MKQEDINKLKELCESNGYYFDFDVISDTAVVAKPKDIWEGVEFVESDGTIVRVTKVNINGFSHANGFVGRNYKGAKPSTEQAYIEQLKKEAFERYGEIKEGDIFDRTEISDILKFKSIPYDKNTKGFGFNYFKGSDSLKIDGVRIYQAGKWAKKIEKAEVKSDGGEIQSNLFYFDMNEEAEKRWREIGYWKVCDYLAKQLEDYLNKKD